MPVDIRHLASDAALPLLSDKPLNYLAALSPHPQVLLALMTCLAIVVFGAHVTVYRTAQLDQAAVPTVVHQSHVHSLPSRDEQLVAPRC